MPCTVPTIMVRHSAVGTTCTLLTIATRTPTPTASWDTPTSFPPVIVMVLLRQGLSLWVHTTSRWMNMKFFSNQVNLQVMIGKYIRISCPLVCVLVFVFWTDVLLPIYVLPYFDKLCKDPFRLFSIFSSCRTVLILRYNTDLISYGL